MASKTYTVSGSPKVTYTVTVTLERISAIKAKVNVSCTTKLGNSESWLGTGHKLVGYIDIPGVGAKSWTIKGSKSTWKGTKAHKSSESWEVSVSPTLEKMKIRFKAVNTYGHAGDLGWQSKFDVETTSGITYATEDHSKVKISSEVESQIKAYVKVSDIPKASYDRKITWYKGDTKLSEENVSSTAHSCSLTNLEPNTTYKITAKITTGSKLIVSKEAYITTPQETGDITLSPRSTYINVEITGMFNSPAYTRVIDLEYKRSNDTLYTHLATLKGQGESVNHEVRNLISNMRYDVKATIQNGEHILKTLKASATTTADTSLIPTAEIISLTQNLGSREVVVRWTADKNIAGTKYYIEAKADGTWETLKTLNAIATPTVVISNWGNKLVAFRIKSINESVALGITNTSNTLPLYIRDDFEWDTPKISGGALIITANEWNRLCDYVLAKKHTDVPKVRIGDPISADTYNAMKNAIGLTQADKRTGDAIRASDIDALRIGINA